MADMEISLQKLVPVSKTAQGSTLNFKPASPAGQGPYEMY